MSDLDIYQQQNFGNRTGFGRRSALVLVDFTIGFNDPKLFGGGNIDAAVHSSARNACPSPSPAWCMQTTAPTPGCSA